MISRDARRETTIPLGKFQRYDCAATLRIAPPRDIQVPLAPSGSRRVIPFAATVLRSLALLRYRSRASSHNDLTPLQGYRGLLASVFDLPWLVDCVAPGPIWTPFIHSTSCPEDGPTRCEDPDEAARTTRGSRSGVCPFRLRGGLLHHGRSPHVARW
jgi:hypothetical protein